MAKVKKTLLINNRHPLLLLREQLGVGVMAKELGHANHTSVSEYCRRAKKKPTTAIPAEWVLPLCRLSGLNPGQLRPDLYLPHWVLTAPSEAGKV